jgi:hypothetical protein
MSVDEISFAQNQNCNENVMEEIDVFSLLPVLLVRLFSI